jgi:hypothetical protein
MERVIALEQAEYLPIVGLPVRFADGTSGMSVRFRLTAEERQAIIHGADIIITELTFGGPFTPLCTDVCMPNELPFRKI